MVDAGFAATYRDGGATPSRDDQPRMLPVTPEDRANMSILIVDDERTLSESCASILRMESYQVTTCNRGNEALDLVRRKRFDIAIFDLYMTQVPGIELLRECLKKSPDTLAIMITGNPSVETSLEALEAGAWDYLPKPFPATHLEVLIGRAAHTVLISRETRAQQEQFVTDAGHSDSVTVLGNAPGFRRTIELARKVAGTDASVFIDGESGTGKELIAQFIHAHSRRSSRELVAINCAALPEPLLESEMFGHCKGAFTGAIRDKPGLLETASGGTLFLDELTEMPVSIQAKLLRVIQDGVVRRVGSNTTDAVVNVRFIAATNRDPKEATEEGVLRQDLYYRLRVVPIRVPPLRERVEDIPLLANHFLRLYWDRHRDKRSRIPRFSPEALRSLQGRPWPGNVRELQNVIEHAVVLAEPGMDIGPDDIPVLDGDTHVPTPSYGLWDYSPDEPYHEARDRVIAGFERNYLRDLVGRATGNMSEAARMAGVDRTTLYRLMEKHGLRRDTIIRMNEG